MPRIIFIFLILLTIQIGSSEVYAQSTNPLPQVEIVNLMLPDTSVANTPFIVSGYFQNTGDVEFNGSLSIYIETSSGFSGGQASFLTSDSSLDNVSLNPGDQLYFTTSVVSTTTTTGLLNSIAIVFPKIGDTVCTFSPIIKNLVIKNPAMDGGN